MFACVFALQKSRFVCSPSKGILDNSAEKVQQQLLATRKRRKKSYAMEKLVEVLQQQIASQDRRYEGQQRFYEEQLQILKELIRRREQVGDKEIPTALTTAVATQNFPAFDSTSEL